MSTNKGIVYSTSVGKICPDCGNPAAECNCTQSTHTNTPDGNVRIERQTKGRKGAGVTVIKNLPLDEQTLRQLAKKLKQKCGSGGTVTSGTIEIQGDKRTLVAEELARLGYGVKG